MALRFDTGAPKAQRTQLFDAIAAALGDLYRSAAPPAYLRPTKRIARIVRPSVNETHDGFGLKLVEDASQGNMPCVLVAFGDAKYSAQGLDPIDSQAELDVQLLVVSSHLGGMETGRLAADTTANADATQDPGLDTMLEHVEERLMGQDLGVPGIHELRWHHVGEVFTAPEYSVWEVRATALLERHVNPDRAETRVVTEIEADHKLDGVPAGGQLDPIVETITPLEAP